MRSYKISIIVPVYNIKQYLSCCVNSILNQYFTDYELILVNDGSTDGSKELCDIYCKIDKRIKAIHLSNGGVSRARNIGLSAALGEWVLFVDGDDYLPNKDSIMALYNASQKYPSVDFIKGNHSVRIAEGRKEGRPLEIITKFSEARNYYAYKILPADEFLNKVILEHCVVWNTLFRKDFLKVHKCKFDENVVIGEDALFLLRYTQHGKGIYMNNVTYTYRINNCQSATHSISEKKLYSLITGCEQMVTLLQDSNNLSIEYIRAASKIVQNNINWSINLIFKAHMSFRRKNIKRLKKICPRVNLGNKLKNKLLSFIYNYLI